MIYREAFVPIFNLRAKKTYLNYLIPPQKYFGGYRENMIYSLKIWKLQYYLPG